MHNEARAIKMSYLACCMREMGKSHVEKNDNGAAFVKFLLKARDSDMFPIGQVRKDFCLVVGVGVVWVCSVCVVYV